MAMSNAKPLAIDYAEKNASSPILARPPLLTSRNFSWNGIYVEQHRQPPGEMSENYSLQHVIGMIQSEQTFSAERVLDGQRREEKMGNGTIVLVPAHVLHKSSWNQTVSFTRIVLDPIYFERVAYEILEENSLNGGIVNRIQLLPHFSQPDPLIFQLGLALESELKSARLGGRLYVDSLTTMLAVHLLRYYCTGKTILDSDEYGLPKSKLDKALDYIHDHLAEDVSLEAIAQYLGMSRFYFARLFKQSMGTTPHQYVLQQRIEKAKGLLKQKGGVIAEIALECGFADQHHFSKQFRHLTGITPKTYRGG
jgi:AraC family transcriptional regulator